MKTILENLKEYYENNTEEQIAKDWDKSKKYDDINSPTVEQFMLCSVSCSLPADDQPNGKKEDESIGILHSVNGYWVSNEGSKRKPSFHVWIPGVTHSTADSAYNDLSLAVARCNYLANTHEP